MASKPRVWGHEGATPTASAYERGIALMANPWYFRLDSDGAESGIA
jgi:hypothetical protein